MAAWLFHSRLLRYGGAVASVAAAILARLLLDPLLGGHYPYPTIFFAVLVTAWLGGQGPALVAVFLGALSSSYFLIPPRGTLHLLGPQEQVGMGLFLVTSLGIALLGGRMQSARRLAEIDAAARQRKARLIDLSHDAMLVWDLNGPITLWSRGAEQLYGFPRTDALGRVSHELLNTGAPGGLGSVLRALEQEHAWEGELAHTTRDGRIITVESRMVLVRDTGGATVLETNRDVTARKARETQSRDENDLLEARVRERTAEIERSAGALRASEQHYRALFDNMLNGAAHCRVLFDEGRPSDLMFLATNRAYTPLTGLRDVEGKRASTLRPGFPDPRLLATATKVVQTGVAERLEFYSAGLKQWFSTVCYRTGDGELAIVFDDVTERKRAEEALRASEELLRSVLDHTIDGIVCIDERGTVSLFNRAGEKLFGRRASEVVGNNVKMLMPEPHRGEHDGYLQRYLETGHAGIIGIGREVRGLRGDGTTFPIALAVTEFELAHGRHFVALVRDISTTKALEAQLHQSQKLEAFGQLAGGVAHDFNNLLTVISGYSEILLDDATLTEDERRSILEDIRQAGGRATALTRQLLAFSRQQVLDPRLVDLNAVVVETEKMLRRLIGEDVELVTLLDPALGTVKVDPGQIEQVLMNLALNARDAMPRGGRITIETCNVELDEPRAGARPGDRSGRFVRIRVSDNGSGMTPQVRARIFEPFFTTKGVGKGTGLGLAVVHGILRQSGGHIEVDSEVGAGTRFDVHLPAVSERSSGAAGLSRATPSAGSETILLVEDESAARELAVRGLRQFSYHVLQATNGKDALRVVEGHEGRIDLLVTDVVMPEMGGRELAEALKARYPGIQVLFMSGYTDDAIVRHGVLESEVAFLTKPFTPRALANKVREVLDKG